MDRTKKLLLSILFDALLLGFVAFSVYKLVNGNFGEGQRTLYMLIIVFCIPLGFLVTFAGVAWEKFDEKELDDDEDSKDNPLF